MNKMNTLKTYVTRHPYIATSSIGLITTCGLILYEKHRIHQFLKKYTRSANQENTKKRPDYIYIKYHIYKESMRKMKQKEEEDKKWVNVIINPIGKWWKSAKHSVAWRLLNIAQTGTRHERLKAVRQLARIDHLKDWDFRHLAQICDARTAISLARSGADKRWFLPVHMDGCIKNPKILLSDWHGLLSTLLKNSCVHHFFNKYFPDQSLQDTMDEFFPQDSLIHFSQDDTDLLKEVIAFLHHLTKDLKSSQHIIENGGLLLLMELRKLFRHDNETLSTLCKVLANMSMVPNITEHFYQSGWVSVLAHWQECSDIRLQVISAKTMANLDYDDPYHTIYPPNVYPLHPRTRTRAKPKADIVFIHGLLGGVFITWRQKDRKPTELGLYGKNAFYTSEADDVFLVGETRRTNGKNNGENGKTKNAAPKQNGNGKVNNQTNDIAKVMGNDSTFPKLDHINDPILKTAKKPHTKTVNISDTATKEFVEDLQNEAELESDWEVVHPDVPLKANDGCCGPFSVSGSEWLNQDNLDDYTNCWPMEWLPEDFPNTRILGIDYTSAVTEWSANFAKYCPCEKGQGQIDIRAATLLERISQSKIGQDRPIIWIGHSMGGILTKIMLLKAKDSIDPQVKQIAKNTNSIVFLGTPHRGSPIAKWKQHMQLILSPSIEVKEMEEGSPRLLELHSRFMDSLKTNFQNIKIVTIAEGRPTMLTTFKFPLRIVTEDSANINVGDFYILKDDHLSLSKPIFRQSFLYQRLLKVIDDSLTEKETSTSEEIPGATIYLQSVKNNKRVAQNSTQTPTKTTKSIFNFYPKISFKLPTPSVET
ncbi:protein SERAC1 [Teleopsis dalmanni]|uniref:protein SERAC1 n=1 Tax=Teleopsis dalmanni TaxID=139649 RepID=UPI0018CEBCAB|nr:protein SERAC1 [Teleopsis dalmanni]